MGLLFSRWKKKESLGETLESLEKDIQGLKSSQQRTEQLQKKFIGYLVLYSIMLYILAAMVFYFYYFPKNWKDQLIGCTPLLVFPVVVYGLKRVLHYVFVSRISKKERRLEDLNEMKKKVLEEVMEKETYRTAKDLLEKYDPKSELVQAANSASAALPNMSNQQQSPKGSAGTEVRQRNVASGNPEDAAEGPLQHASPVPSMADAPPQRPMGPGPQRTTPPLSPVIPRNANNMMNLGTPSPGAFRAPMPPRPGPPKPAFPILPRERTAVDKLVEYLVGDGPNNRYALICKQCYSHNGMALKEEFEYTTFRCCYCYRLNIAEKQRPTAPKLDNIGQSSQQRAEEQQQQQLKQNKQTTDGVQSEENQLDPPPSKDAKEAKTEDVSEIKDGETVANGTHGDVKKETEGEEKKE